MYTEKDEKEAKKALILFIALYSVFAVALLVCFFVALVRQIAWLSYMTAGVLTVVSLFVWGNFGAKLLSWHRFLRDMRVGLQREAVGEISGIEEDIAVRDGLEFRALRLMTGEESDKAGGRLLYVDASRFPIPAKAGQKVRLELFGNYVKSIEELEDV